MQSLTSTLVPVSSPGAPDPTQHVVGRRRRGCDSWRGRRSDLGVAQQHRKLAPSLVGGRAYRSSGDGRRYCVLPHSTPQPAKAPPTGSVTTPDGSTGGEIPCARDFG